MRHRMPVIIPRSTCFWADWILNDLLDTGVEPASDCRGATQVDLWFRCSRAHNHEALVKAFGPATLGSTSIEAMV